jgi:2-keto-4-pentenoate hydratase
MVPPMGHDVAAIAQRLWGDIQRGDHFPGWLADQLDLEAALAVQVALLGEQRRSGEFLSGWKVGLTSERARQALGSDTRPFGYLLASHTFRSGAQVDASAIRHGSIEPEFLFTIGARLAGPDLGPADVRAGTARVAAGFELNERRPGSVRPDLALMATDRMTQWGIVEGDGVDPAGIDGSLDDVRVRLSCDGVERLAVRGGDEVDDHWTSIARLVAVLDRHGLALEPGQKVITGGLSRFDLAPGQRWRAEFDGVGAVEVDVR